MLQFVKATRKHLEELKETIRPIDREELELCTGLPAEDVLELGFSKEGGCYAYLFDESVLCIFGVNPYPLNPSYGIPWMVLTPLGEANWFEAIRACKDKVEEVGKEYKYLFNFVYEKNTTSIRWLRWCGFTIHPPVPIGPSKALFHPFIKGT